jgi:hypothetical protein
MRRALPRWLMSSVPDPPDASGTAFKIPRHRQWRTRHVVALRRIQGQERGFSLLGGPVACHDVENSGKPIVGQHITTTRGCGDPARDSTNWQKYSSVASVVA